MAEKRRNGPIRSEASRQAILSAASAQFIRTGDVRLSLEAIAAEAEVGKRTIYHWWASREELIAECLSEGFLVPKVLEIPRTKNLRSDLNKWLTDLASATSDPKQLTVIRALIMHSSSDISLRESVQKRLGIDAELRDLIYEAQERGEIAKGRSAPVLADALIGIITVRMLLGSALDPEEIVNTLFPTI